MASHESTYQPKTRIEKWLDARLPVMRMMHAQFVDFPTPRNINYLWTAGALLTFCLAVQILTGIVLAMHYAPTRGRRLQQRRAHPPRRELRLADPQHPRGRRLHVLPGRLHPHRPRPLLRLLQGAARGALDHRRRHLPADDGHRLHGLLAALGPDELLGGDRHHQPVLLARLGHPGPRHAHRAVAVGRLLGVGHDADALLQPALPAALRDRRRRGAAHLGAARGRPEQPDRPRDQDGLRHACRWRRTRS